MNKILVGYDGSEPSAHALDEACVIARAYGAPLTVLTSAEDRMVREDGHKTMAADEDLARWIADQGAQRARAAGVAAVDTQISVEDAAHALVHTAQAGDYDLVVVGHRGLGALKELFLGSTAKTIVDKLHCSVLIVR